MSQGQGDRALGPLGLRSPESVLGDPGAHDTEPETRKQSLARMCVCGEGRRQHGHGRSVGWLCPPTTLNLEGRMWGRLGEGYSLASGSQATVRSALQPFIVWTFHHTTPSSLPNSWLPLPISPDSALHPSPALVTFPGPPCLIPADLLPTSPSSVHGSKPMDRTPSPPRISPSSSLSLVRTPLFLQPHCAPGMRVLSSNWSSICLDTGSSPLSPGEPHLQPHRDPQTYLGLDLSAELQAAVTWTRPAAGRP